VISTINTDKKIMKTKLLMTIAVVLMVFGVKAQNSIPNGNFESWTSSTFEDPQFYKSSNSENYHNNLPFNCIKTTDAYHGSYAVKLTTGANKSMAYFLNSQPNGDPPWHGGMPFNQKPTGIRGYYKSAVPAGDSAFVLVNLSKNGTGIGFYTFKFYGTHSTYTPFSFTFKPALTVAPDSIIVGFASSDVFNDIAITGSMIQVDSISFTGVISQPANFNGDFELWQSQTINNLNDWYTDNWSVDQAILKSTDKVAGQYAVELKTLLGDRDGRPYAQNGRISNGKWDKSCNCMIGGFPFSNQTDTLVFWYKYVPASSDSFQFNLSFKKNGNQFDGRGAKMGASSTYKLAIFPFSLSQAPDSVIVEIQSSLWQDTLVKYVGTSLKLDEIHFKSQPLFTSISSNARDEKTIVFPNPTSGIFNLVSDIWISKVEVMNSLGEIVYSAQVDSDRANIDLSTQSKGIYYYHVYAGKEMTAKGKIIVR
jgi:hypothetical protein